MAEIIIGARLQRFAEPGSMGVVTDVHYVRCFWPKLNQPTALFADGSRGIGVLASPTPRNVVFPKDTIFLEAVLDAFYPAELAVMAMSPRRAGLVNLTEAEAAVWWAAYEAAIAELPPTATRIKPESVHFLRHKELVSAPEEKARYDEYVAELPVDVAVEIAEGKADIDAVKAAAEFVSSSASREDPTTKVYHVEKNGTGKDVLVEVVKAQGKR